jgi:hypothetical protein
MLVRQSNELRNRLANMAFAKAEVERQRDLLRRQLAGLQSTSGCQRLAAELDAGDLTVADVKRALAKVIEDQRLELRRED